MALADIAEFAVSGVLALVSKPGKDGADSILAEIGKVQARETSIKERLAALAARRDGLLRSDDDKALDADDAEISRLHRALDKIGLALDELNVRLAQAREREADQGRRQLFDDAKKAAVAATKGLQRYPAMARQITGLIKATAEADALVAKANANLPEGVAPLEFVEQSVRGRPSQPTKVLSTRFGPPEWYMADSDGKLDEKYIGNVVVDAEGQSGTVRFPGGTYDRNAPADCRVVLRAVKTEQFQPGTPAFRPTPLAALVTLPGFAPGEPAFYDPLNINPHDDDPQAILRHVAALEAALAAPVEPVQMQRPTETRTSLVRPDASARVVDSVF